MAQNNSRDTQVLEQYRSLNHLQGEEQDWSRVYISFFKKTHMTGKDIEQAHETARLMTEQIRKTRRSIRKRITSHFISEIHVLVLLLLFKLSYAVVH